MLYQKYGNFINLLLIGAVIVYLVLQKYAIIEGFDAQTIDFSALDNIANVCKGLNSTGKHIFPGDLEIKGKLIISGGVEGDLKVTGDIESGGNIVIKKALHITGENNTGQKDPGEHGVYTKDRGYIKMGHKTWQAYMMHNTQNQHQIAFSHTPQWSSGGGFWQPA